MNIATLLLALSSVALVQQEESLEERTRRQREETERILSERRSAPGESAVPDFEAQQEEMQRRLAEMEARNKSWSGTRGGRSSRPGPAIPFPLLLMRGLPFKTPTPTEYASIQAEIQAAVKAGDYKLAAEWAELLGTKPTWREMQSETFRTTTSKVGNVGAGFLTFTGGYLGKEALHSLEAGDGERFRNAVAYTKTPQFWISTAVAGSTMTYTANALDKSARFTKFAAAPGTAGKFARTARLGVPLYAGVASLRVMEAMATGGDVNGALVDSGVTTGSYLAAHGMVRGATRLAVDGAIRAGGRFLLGFATKGLYAPLLAMGPWGWAAAGVLFVAETAVTMYLGDKIEAWIRGTVPAGGERRNWRASSDGGREGVAQKIERIGS